MGSLHVHEFMTLDGVIDARTWTLAAARVFAHGVLYLNYRP